MLTQQTDWAVAPITGDPRWQRLEAPRPDLVQVATDAIRVSGADPREVNRVTCVALVANLVKGMGTHYLRVGGMPEAADGFEEVASRPDYDVDHLWNYFSHHGAVGVAAQKQVVEHLTNGDAAGIVADLIRNGECGFGFGGTDRI
ncbi:MAG TPA: hypothetical protein GXZ45_05055 [Propionibacterium sp.]|nr:hypothetical protein [Propionibacterium sp.]